MGHLQKIMYVHVPAAWNAFLAFVVVLVGSVMYLWKREEKWDLLAASAAEVAAVLTALTIALGSIWGRPTWGVWWTWDPRLTSTAILLVIIVGYLALRSFVDEPERRARWSAALASSARSTFRSCTCRCAGGERCTSRSRRPSTVDPAYAWGLRLNAIAFLLVHDLARAHAVPCRAPRARCGAGRRARGARREESCMRLSGTSTPPTVSPGWC